MASIRRRGGNYQVRFRDPSGRQRSRTFRRKSDADKFASVVEAKKLQGEWVDQQLGKAVYAEWASRWHQSRIHLRDSSRNRDESYLRNLILPTFGNRPINSIQRVDIQRWVHDLVNRGYAPRTVKQAHVLLSGSLKAAVRDNLLVRNPAEGVDLPITIPRPMQILTPEEVETLADRVSSRYRVLVLTAAYTGLRWGELIGLTPDRLNLLRRQVLVSQQVTEVAGKLKLVQILKTKSSARTVDLPAFLVEELAEHIRLYPGEYVFTASGGGPVRRSNFYRRVWKPTAPTGFRFHDLRHSHAAMLIANGEHPKVIQVRLGHSSITTTLDTYGHLYDGLGEAAAQGLNDLRNEARVAKMWTGTDGPNRR